MISRVLPSWRCKNFSRRRSLGSSKMIRCVIGPNAKYTRSQIDEYSKISMAQFSRLNNTLVRWVYANIRYFWNPLAALVVIRNALVQWIFCDVIKIYIGFEIWISRIQIMQLKFRQNVFSWKRIFKNYWSIKLKSSHWINAHHGWLLSIDYHAYLGDSNGIK